MLKFWNELIGLKLPMTPLKKLAAMGGVVMSSVESMSPRPSCCTEAFMMPAAAALLAPVGSSVVVNRSLTNSAAVVFSTKSMAMSDTTANMAVANIVDKP